MAETRYIQNNLNAGELSPRLNARDDFDRYTNGVKEMTNFTPMVQGGARARAGLQWVARTRDNAKAYLIPFEFSTTQAYIIEAGEQYFRFYRDGGRIFDISGTITGAANNGAGLIRITDVAHGLSTGSRVEISGVLGTVEANGEWVVTVISADTFDLQGSAFVNAYTSGGIWNRPYEIATPYTLADLSLVRWSQSADTLYLAHGTYAPRKLTRTGHTAWTLSTITFIDGPFQNTNITATTMTSSVTAVGAVGTLTASAAYFNANMVGAFFRLFVGGVWGYVKVDSYTSPTVVNITVITLIGGVGATATWREGSFSTHRGFPSCLAFIEQRLVYAATATEQQTLWMSSTGSYDDFTPTASSGTVNSDHGITYKLGSDTGKVNVIRWMSGGRNLVVGTVGEEFILDGGSIALTPTSPPVARASTTYGSAAIQAVRSGRQTFYVHRSGRKIRSMSYDFGSDTYLSPDLSVYAEHLIRATSITRITYQNEPDTLLWCVLADGSCITLSYDEIHKLVGWAHHETDGFYRDVAVIPSTDLTGDTPWFVVKRTINGVDRYFVEFATYDQDSDSSLTYNGTVTGATVAASAVSGAGVTFTASVATFTAADVGKEIILLAYEVAGVKWYSRALITAFTDTTHVVGTITANFPNTSPVTAGKWGLGKFNVTGIHHLVGETVKVTGDMAVYDDQVVTAAGGADVEYGSTAGPAAVVIKVGLARTPNPKIETLQPAYRDQRGVIRGRFKHWAEVHMAVENTVGLTVNGKTQVQYRTPADPMDQGPPAFTGDKKISNLGWSREGLLSFEQELPLPATLLAYYGELDVAD